MTNPNTPQQPEGTGPGSQEPQQPLVAPEPLAQAGPYSQEAYSQAGAYSPALGLKGQPPQPPFARPGQPPQQPAPALPTTAKRPARPARPRVDPHGVPYGVGPFTLREAIFLGAVGLVFLASLLPFLGGEYADVFGYSSAWTPAGWLVIPAAVLLVAAAALIVVRRLTKVRRLSVGSLSVDQFASAASVVTAGFYLGALFLIAGFPAWFGGGSDILEPGAGVIVGLVFSLVAVAVTTLAPALPVLDADFTRRAESAAHPVARPASDVPRRPKTERPPAEPDEQPAPHFGQTGLSLPQAGPGEFAAYQRRGAQPGAHQPGVNATDAAPPASPAEPTAVFDTADVSQPVAVQPVDVQPVDVQHDSPQHDSPQHDSPQHDLTEPNSGEPASADATRVLPTAAESQTFPPGFVATDVPEVDPGNVARPVPREEHDVTNPVAPDHEDGADDERSEPGYSDGPAPVSAFSHVSARATAGSADAATASDVSEPAREQPTAVFSTQPFWVYSPVPRPVVDEVSGATVFEIGPTAWALAILDRGTELVIRHDDGRVGVLQNLEGITRG